MIKREFYRDEKIGELVPPARLLFISTWIQADDSGNCVGDPRVLRSEAFPFDDDISSATVDGWISDMEKLGLVERYQVSDQKYLHITNFLRHQVIDRPSQFRYPIPSQGVLVESSPNPQRAHDEHSVLKVKVKVKSKSKEKVKANGNGDSHDRSLDQLPKRPCAKESEDAWTYTGLVRSRIDERFFAAGQFEGVLAESFEEYKAESHVIEEGVWICCCLPSDALEAAMSLCTERGIEWPRACKAQKERLVKMEKSLE